MRIISGQFRGKKLLSEEGLTTRPTADRVRESVFNILEARFLKNGTAWTTTSVLDAFAGFGGLSAESLSRGAAFLSAFEKNEGSRKILEKNLAIFPKEKIRLGKDLFASSLLPKSLDLVFLDPPYGEELIERALSFLQSAMKADATVVAETERGENFSFDPAIFILEDERKYGKTCIRIMRKK